MAANKENTVDKAQIEVPKLEANKDYVIVGTGKSSYLREGVEYPVGGADAMALIESGKATLKDK